ncbi:hypothetical protein BH10PSE17_BH10PSE17_24510 [soil metagenome]
MALSRHPEPALAPQIDGFGNNAMRITTRSTVALRQFRQGMEQVYAFNESEAVRAFKAAWATDPSCAMCAWGIALQLGPTLVAPGQSDLGEARRYVADAERAATALGDRERGLIEALSIRYGPGDVDPTIAAALDASVCSAAGEAKGVDKRAIAYAERMRLLSERFPDDPDILALYAEAEMIATDEDWWNDETGKPGGRMGAVTDRLEAALRTNPGHTGLNHYMIHAADSRTVARRAEAASDRLGSLAPKSPHLVHMPSHIYARLGRYGDAMRVNQTSLDAEGRLDAALASQGFKSIKDWRGHDGQFLWYAALMDGRGEVALQAARDSAGREAAVDSEIGEFVRARPLLTLLRLERWNELLAEPVASGDKGVARVVSQYARGVAWARTGNATGAAQALAAVEIDAASLEAAHSSDGYVDRLTRSLASVSRERLRAEVAMVQGRGDAALVSELKAVDLARDLESSEPPMLAADAQLRLGDLQMRMRRFSEAEQIYRDDLIQHPGSGWALRGLARTLKAQGRVVEAADTQARLEQHWREADARLLSSN